MWAEEPGTIICLWTQRLRWARGNLQVTRIFRSIRFRPQATSRVGSVAFGMLWFSLLLQPFIMIAASAALVALYLLNFSLAFRVFAALWLVNIGAYIFILTYTLLSDPGTGRRPIREALLYVKEITRAEARWDKTQKSGKVATPA